MPRASIPRSVVLRYWPCRGRVQALADFLADREIPFEQERPTLGGEAWAAMREDAGRAGPFASLPVLSWGGRVLAETLPIAGFLTRTLCLPPQADPELATRHDMFCSAAYLDVSRPLADLIWSRVDIPGVDLPKRARVVLPRALEKLRRIGIALDPGAPYIGGDSPAVADFFVFEALEEMAYVMGAEQDRLAEVLPQLTAHRNRLRVRPALEASFRGDRPDRYTACPEEPQVLVELESFPWAKLCASFARAG